jgi:hypothetical protein
MLLEATLARVSSGKMPLIACSYKCQTNKQIKQLMIVDVLPHAMNSGENAAHFTAVSVPLSVSQSSLLVHSVFVHQHTTV